MSLTLNQAEIKFIKELREKVINFLPTPERELTTLEKYVEYTEEHIIIHDPVCGDITMMNKNLWSEVVGIGEDSYGYYYTHEEALKAVPEGYHLPESRERVRVRDVLVRLGILKDDYDGETFSEVLKLPLAGDRYRASGFLSHQGPYAYYWASTPNGTNAYSLFFNSTDLYPQYGSNRADGFSVRCFQNSK